MSNHNLDRLNLNCYSTSLANLLLRRLKSKIEKRSRDFFSMTSIPVTAMNAS